MNMSRLEYFQRLVGSHTKDYSRSPYGRWLNGKLVELEQGRLRMEHDVRDDMTNPVGMLHGGVTAGIIDDAMGMLFFTLGLDVFYPTINLSIDYLAGARQGDVITTKVWVVRQGKTIINLQATVTDTKERIIAQASSNLAASNIQMP